MCYFLHDPCSFLFSCFSIVDLFSHTDDFIDNVNILNIIIGADSSEQRLNKSKNGPYLVVSLKCEMCLTKTLFRNDTLLLWRCYHNVNDTTLSMFCYKTYIFTINERKTDRDIEENETVMKPTQGCNISFRI